MKKLFYIQPEIEFVEVQEETPLLTTSEIVTRYSDFDPDYEGSDNGEEELEF